MVAVRLLEHPKAAMSGNGAAAARIAALYTLFAVVATAVNLGTQFLVMLALDAAWPSWPFTVHVALVVGTGVGLVLKYLLDKRWIFRFRAQSLTHDARTFALYTVMSLVTTVIFWGAELGFHYAFDSPGLTLVGGGLGLAVGYVIKYALDKRFVFRTEEQPA